mmetsp:Transcript_5106/g.7777  ORF Transcript_5106/g.7777 Transcript_5106/m.7777 type:complete len:444 (+) Transcript_5106:99-1430(+)
MSVISPINSRRARAPGLSVVAELGADEPNRQIVALETLYEMCTEDELCVDTLLKKRVAETCLTLFYSSQVDSQTQQAAINLFFKLAQIIFTISEKKDRAGARYMLKILATMKTDRRLCVYIPHLEQVATQYPAVQVLLHNLARDGMVQEEAHVEAYVSVARQHIIGLHALQQLSRWSFNKKLLYDKGVASFCMDTCESVDATDEARMVCMGIIQNLANLEENTFGMIQDGVAAFCIGMFQDPDLHPLAFATLQNLSCCNDLGQAYTLVEKFHVYDACAHVIETEGWGRNLEAVLSIIRNLAFSPGVASLLLDKGIVGLLCSSNCVGHHANALEALHNLSRYPFNAKRMLPVVDHCLKVLALQSSTANSKMRVMYILENLVKAKPNRFTMLYKGVPRLLPPSEHTSKRIISCLATTELVPAAFVNIPRELVFPTTTVTIEDESD